MITHINDAGNEAAYCGERCAGGIEPTRCAPFGGPALSVLHASTIADAFELISIVRTNQSVLLNCSRLERSMGQRLVDICSGGVTALDGRMHRISAEVVLFAPALTRLETPDPQTEVSSAN